MPTPPVPLSEFSHVPVALATRFEVLARDHHTCQFCGRRAPDVTLTVERLRPLIDGGSSSSLNLVTSCTECGIGRRSVIARIYRSSSPAPLPPALMPATATSEAWREALGRYNEAVLAKIISWLEDVGHPDAGEPARRSIMTLIHRAGADRVWAAFADTAPKAIELDAQGRASDASIESILNGLPRWVDAYQPGAETRRLLSIRGVLRSRLAYVRENEVMQAMEGALELGVPVALIEAAARQCRGWAEFWSALTALSSSAPP